MNYQKKVFPVKFVADQILQGTRVKNRYKCPFCDGTNTLSITPEKNLFHCFKCGEAGDTVSLYAKMNNLTYKEAIPYVDRMCGNLSTETIHQYSMAATMVKADDIYQRNMVYHQFLDELTLKPSHRDNLINRGLTDEDIKRLDYKSLSLRGCSFEEKDAIAKVAVKNYQPGNKWIGIPGFYDLSTDKPKISVPAEGILIPVRTNTMKISGFQIRYNDLPENATPEMEASFHRYGWFTSGGKETGCTISGCDNIHHAGNWFRVNFPKVIGLTEGALKADVAATLYDRLKPREEHLFLGLTGVSNTSQLADELTHLGKLGCEEIHIFVDMDYRDKQAVAKALKKIETIVTSTKYESDVNGVRRSFPMRCKTVTWDPRFKGIDDYLLQRWMCTAASR